MWFIYKSYFIPFLLIKKKKPFFFFTENLCLFFLDTAKCTYLYCSKFSLLEFCLAAQRLQIYNDNHLFSVFMDYVYDRSYCVAVLSS